MSIVIGIAAFISTLLGGLFALKLKDRLHLVLGFSAGAIIAVSFFEILPEAIELGSGTYNVSTVTSFVGLGFLVYLILDRLIILHSHNTEDYEICGHSEQRGMLGAGSLSFHSFLDGVVVGLAFQAGPAVGLIVSAAVLTHDFSDGVNTANLILKNGGTVRKALLWIIADAIAPMLGILSTLFFTLPTAVLGLILAVFAGDFLYIGASDLLPESHHKHPKILTTVMTAIGMVVIYTIVKIAA
mgnify:CR=1 FL=1